LICFICITFYIIDSNLILKKENSGKLKKIKANVINFDQSEDDIQTAEEVKSDNDVLLHVGNEASSTSVTSYDTIVRFILLILKTMFTQFVALFLDWLFYRRI